MEIIYNQEADTLHLWLQETTVTTKKFAEGVAAGYDRNGQIAWIEVLDAAKRRGGQDSLQQTTLEGAGPFVAVWGSKTPGAPFGTYFAEALSWLQSENVVAEGLSVGDSSERLSQEDALVLVRELYEASAVQVRVEGKYLDEVGEGADYLEIVLPQDTAARKKLFAIGAQVMQETGSCSDPAEEVGQASFTIGW